MSIADIRAVRSRQKLRYRNPSAHRTVAQSIEMERQKAARMARIKKKK